MCVVWKIWTAEEKTEQQKLSEKREFLNEEAAERATPIHIKKKKRE